MAMTFVDWGIRHLEEFVAHLDRVWGELCEYQSDARTERIEGNFDFYDYRGPYHDDEYVTPEYEFIKVLLSAKSLLQVMDREKIAALPLPEAVPFFYYVTERLLVEQAKRYLEAVMMGEALLEKKEGKLPEEAKNIASDSYSTIERMRKRAATEFPETLGERRNDEGLPANKPTSLRSAPGREQVMTEASGETTETFGEWNVRFLKELIAHLERAWSDLRAFQSYARTARIERDDVCYSFAEPELLREPVTPEYEFIKVLQFAKSFLQVVDRKKLDELPQSEVAPLVYLTEGLLVRRGQRYLKAVRMGEALLEEEEEEGEFPREARKIATDALETLDELDSRMG